MELLDTGLVGRDISKAQDFRVVGLEQMQIPKSKIIQSCKHDLDLTRLRDHSHMLSLQYKCAPPPQRDVLDDVQEQDLRNAPGRVAAKPQRPKKRGTCQV